MKKIKILLCIGLMLMVSSCSNTKRHEENLSKNTDEILEDPTIKVVSRTCVSLQSDGSGKIIIARIKIGKDTITAVQPYDPYGVAAVTVFK